ncbi:uncharacterized protein LOC113474413 [Ciona intestinalis]
MDSNTTLVKFAYGSRHERTYPKRTGSARMLDGSKWHGMPYEGCGIMYENLPHYCPTELFMATKSGRKQKLQDVLVAALKSKMEAFENEVTQTENGQGQLAHTSSGMSDVNKPQLPGYCEECGDSSLPEPQTKTSKCTNKLKKTQARNTVPFLRTGLN